MTEHGPQKVTAADGHVYHKSATANATTAPTNEATVANVTKQGSLTLAELDLVTVFHYEFGLNGEINKDAISAEYGYSVDELTDALSKEHIRAALDERGVKLDRAPVGLTASPVGKSPMPTIKAPKLTPKQLIVANMMLDLTDNRSDKKKLQDCGVTTSQYQMWLRDPNFSKYLQDRAEALIGDMQHEAMLSLADNVRAGKMDAIKYYHEMTGRYVQQSTANAAGGSNVDFQNMVIRIVEIIIEEVDDPAVASRISDRLKGLVVGNVVAGVIEGPEIVQPTVAKAREQTPEVQQLMKLGLGYNQ